VYLRDVLAIEKVSTRLSIGVETTLKLKELWLLKTFDASAEKYFEIAETYLKAMDVQHKVKRGTAIGWEDFFRLIVNEDATPRVLALFLSVCSIVAVIFLKDPNALTYLIEAFESVSILRIAFLDIMFALGLFFSLIALKQMYALLTMLIISTTHSLTGQRSKSDFVAKILIRDLVSFHRVKVAKVRLKVEDLCKDVDCDKSNS
jgi:hypothetical protein